MIPQRAPKTKIIGEGERVIQFFGGTTCVFSKHMSGQIRSGANPLSIVSAIKVVGRKEQIKLDQRESFG